YYPPGVYYLTSTCYALLRDWTGALLGTHLLMMLLSGLALYGYARQVMSRFAAAVAMSAYVLGPYHLLDQYQRGALAELLGFIWMPLMLLAGERLMERERRGEGARGRGGEEELNESREGDKGEREAGGWRGEKVWWVVVLGMSYGAFIWSHPPTAYQFSLGYAVAMAVLALVRREWRGLVWIGGGL